MAAATGYGYVSPNYGYLKIPKVQPVQPQRSLALAAAGTPTWKNPFGLQTAKNTTGYTGDLAGSGQGIMPDPGFAKTTAVPFGSGTGNSGAPVNSAAAQASAPSTAPTLQTTYDINTDPVLQQENSLAGLSDEQAQAAALKQKQDMLLSYGDPGLVQKVLGDSTLAQAAAQNPTSTVATYQQQRDRGLHDLTEGLNSQNLLYSGYRVLQEQQAAQDYQNALAQAAAGVNQGLGGIDSSLAGVLGQNQRQRVQALSDAQNRSVQAAIANAAATPAAAPTDGSGGTGTATGTIVDYGPDLSAAPTMAQVIAQSPALAARKGLYIPSKSGGRALI